MHVFLTGGTGAIGKALVPHLLAEGHRVSVLVRNAAKATEIESRGGSAYVADPFDRPGLTALVQQLAPEAILHQLTALTHANDFRRFDQDFALTNRFRTEVTDTLIAAGSAAGTRRLIVQSFCGWPYARVGGPVKDETAPLDPTPPATFRRSLEAIRYQEHAIQIMTGMEGLALRYGILYGPGTSIARSGTIVQLVNRRKLPLIGSGAGIWSFTHVADVAVATTAALSRGTPGIYNVVDDEPAPVGAWLPYLAQVVGAKPPHHIPVWLGRLAVGAGGVSMMTQIRGGSNAKARRELGWTLRYPSWRQGFLSGLSNA